MTPASLLVAPLMVAAPLLGTPVAQPQQAVTAPVALGAEAWYASPQLCLLPSTCLPISIGKAPIYPAGTLHIAAAAGSESARTYLSLRQPLAQGVVIKNALLRLPLDTSTTDGSVAPDLAKVKACTTTVRIKTVSASTASPPAVNCTDAPTSRVIGTPVRELDIDLRPIAGRLATPGTSLALLPVLSLGATWNVTLSSDQRAKGSETTPVLLLSTVAADTGVPTASPTPTPSSSEPAVVPPVVIPSVPAPPQASEAPAGPASEPVIAPEAMSLPSRAKGFDYPVVFLVPLLVLAGLLAFGRQLTGPLTRREDRSG